MADRKLVVGADGTATYVDLSPADIAQQPIDAAAAAAAATTASARTALLGSISADTSYQDLVTKLKNATPAQIQTYVQNNVTDLASAKVLLFKILLIMGRELVD